MYTKKDLEHPAKQIKSDRKSQEPYDFTRTWEYTIESNNNRINKKNKQTKTRRHRQQDDGHPREGGL